MSKRILIILMGLLSSWSVIIAQTSMEDLIAKYADVKGARDFVARGSKMTIARSFIRRYPVAPIADKVKALAVLKMERTSEQVRNEFQYDLDMVLNGYEYYGKHETNMGIVDIYIFRSSPETVSELIVYNPAIWSLNCLYGDFTVESLLELDSTGNE